MSGGFFGGLIQTIDSTKSLASKNESIILLIGERGRHSKKIRMIVNEATKEISKIFANAFTNPKPKHQKNSTIILESKKLTNPTTIAPSRAFDKLGLESMGLSKLLE